MLIPVQQTPIPFDPARQALTPPPPPEPPPPPRPADVPIQAGDTPQDQFSANANGRGSGQSPADDQQRAAAADKLRSAYARLTQLQIDATAALQSGDAGRAKEVAQEAAQVAEFIRTTAYTLPMSNVGAIQAAADQLASHVQLGSAGGQLPALEGGGSGVTAALDTARAGLGTAKTVVDTAASLPHHPEPDRLEINVLRKQVIDAMASVEAIAAAFAGPSQPSGSLSKTHVDIRA